MTWTVSLVECVPNVSEGRRLAVISSMADAMARIPDARVLDVSSDPSHNRSVFTLAGEPAPLEHAVLALVERAVADIDLRTQRGEHPRVGAVDVVPFVPLGTTPMSACVDLAKHVGKAISARFGIPVYLYEHASADPHRSHLEDIRRGGLAALTERMKQPAWAPDFGPRTPHPTAGVTVVGARRPLIAFNVNLASDRLDVAKQIARTVRQSGGGLPCVKALGLRLRDRGIVQVSMNLTDYERTSLPRAFDAVRDEATRLGVSVRESEIVGLVPAAALSGVTPADVGLSDFDANQILERRLERTAGP
jgi:glutamate formiminotransferase